MVFEALVDAIPALPGLPSRHRWVFKRTNAWLAGFDQLRIRFERRLNAHYAWLKLAFSLIRLRFIDRFC